MFISKSSEGYTGCQIPVEGRRAQRWICCDNNYKEEDIISNINNDKFYLINLDRNDRCKNNCFEIAGYMPDEIISKNILDARL